MQTKSNAVMHRRLAVITGASSGIGFELAKIFAKESFNLIIAAEDVGIVTAAETLKELGVEVEFVQVDLATEQGVEKLFSKIMLVNKPIDAIAMNAGFAVFGEFEKTSLQEEIKMIELNVSSIVRLTKKVLPELIKNRQGRILYTSSLTAAMPGPYFAVYAATKAFVQSFAEALRVEVKNKGITVTSLQPGVTDTNFYARAHMLETKTAQNKKDDPAMVAREGFEALMSGKDHVVAGSFKNKMQSAMAKVIPEKTSAKIQAKDLKPDSVH